MTGIQMRVFRACAAAMLAVALAGCVPGLDKAGKSDSATAAPGTVLTGDAIEVTPLGPPGTAAPTAAPAAAPTAAAPAAASSAGAATTPPPEAAATDAEPATTETAADPEVAAPEAVAPAVIKSEVWLACEKAGGVWSNTGSGITSCVWNTKDSGKRCSSSTQCDGQCLARSGTCSPFKPLFGCNEILDDSGRRMTECLN